MLVIKRGYLLTHRYTYLTKDGRPTKTQHLLKVAKQTNVGLTCTDVDVL